jgi:hypothetical protein
MHPNRVGTGSRAFRILLAAESHMIQKTLALLIVAGALAVAAVFGCDRSPLARLNAPEQLDNLLHRRTLE